jgi:hypothetical protein
MRRVESQDYRLPVVPAEVIDLGVPAGVESLVDDLQPARPVEETGTLDRRRRVLRNLLDQAATEARTVVKENRYTDVDYQNEHGRYYSSLFRSYPSTAKRLHFFIEPPPSTVGDPAAAASFQGLAYRGYSVVRPVPGAPVGRTMLAPPRALADAVTCLAVDRPNLFGVTHPIEAMPFTSQDGQLGVCAHAAAWMVAYYHRLRNGGARWLPGDIAAAATPSANHMRPVASDGLTVEQLADTLRNLGLPCLLYRPTNLPPGETLTKIALRYLDSSFPIIVATDRHAFVLIGYQSKRTRLRRRVQFVCHDDDRGPYRPWEPRSGQDTWRCLIVPLPPDIYVPGERAEPLGRERLRRQLMESSGEPRHGSAPFSRRTQEACRKLLNQLNGEVELVTSAVRSNQMKSWMTERGAPADVADAYRRIPMPKWVWVVEAVRMKDYAERRPSVVAEVLIDATDHSRDMRTLAWRVPGSMWHWEPDTDYVGEKRLSDTGEVPLYSLSASAWRRPLDRR